MTDEKVLEQVVICPADQHPAVILRRQGERPCEDCVVFCERFGFDPVSCPMKCLEESKVLCQETFI